MELVSIIISVFNAEKYIEKCLDSFLIQDYKNIEIIIINDGSTDGTADIVKKFRQIDSRIRYKEITNSGIPIARNHGLEMAAGEYITFADADDYVEKNYVSSLLKGIKKYNVDICSCQAVDHHIKNGKEEIIKKCEGKEILVYAKDYDFFDPGFPKTVWGVIFKKEVIGNIRFDEDLLSSQDTVFLARCLRKTDRLIILFKNLYHYIIYSESACHGKYNKKRKMEFVAWHRIIMEYKDMPEVYDSCRACYADRCLKVIRRYYFEMGVSERFYKKMLREYRCNIRYIFKRAIQKHKGKDFIMAFAYLLFAIFPRIYPIYYKLRYSENA